MADRTTKLSIILRTVDQATAGIRAVSKRLEEATRPTRQLREALGGLREASGLDSLIGGFRGVGSAISDLLGKVTLIGGVVGGAVAGLFHLVDGFDELGDKAEAAGVSVDFLASMRYAAERSGASIESLDSSVQSLSVNMGMLRAGKGKMLSFLQVVSPALVRQLKATKSNEEAFNLLARATAKIEDPAKRAAFAQKTLGDATLAPLLGKGAKGIQELRDRYLELNPDVGEAAKRAGEVDDAMKGLKASSDGVKSALVVGLAPALKVIVERLSKWLVGHRQDIKEWAMWLGDRLPGAVATLVEGVSSAVSKVGNFVDAIGGWKTVAIGLAAVITGPLIGAIGSLGVALLTTPIGWFAAGIAGIVGAAALIRKHWEGIKGFFSDLWEGVVGAFDLAWERITGIVDKIRSAAAKIGGIGAVTDAVEKMQGDRVQSAIGAIKGFGGTPGEVRNQIVSRTSDARVTIDIPSAPPGTRARIDSRSTADVDMSLGHQMGLSP